MKRWAMLGLMLLLLCGCGKQTISLPEAQQPDREPKPSASEGSGETAQVQKENTENDTDSAETDASGKAYQQEYFTNEAASDAETIRADAAPRKETAQVDADEAQCNAMLEYARCLYPNYQADHAELSEKLVDGTAYLFAAIADKDGTTFCTIAYNAQKDIYYLYDSKMNQLIPIEYDEYGVRLVS